MGASSAEDDARVRLIIIWVAREARANVSVPDGTAWHACTALSGTPAGRFAAAAVQRIRSTYEAGVELPSELVTGALRERRPRLRGRVATSEACPSVAERTEAANAECERLRQCLRAAEGPAEWRQ